MSTGKRIAKLRTERGLNQIQLAKLLKVSPSTIAMWETDKRAIKDDSLLSIANFFNVSTDYLLGRESQYWELSEKEVLDIGELADKMMEGLTNESDVSFYGEPMTDEEKEQMRTVIELGLRMNKEKAKKKFTPNKYRNDTK